MRSGQPRVDLSADGHGDGGTHESTSDTPISRARKGVRSVYYPEAQGRIDVPVYDRYSLVAGDALEGPAIVEERESTTVTGIGDVIRVDGHGNLRIEVARP